MSRGLVSGLLRVSREIQRQEVARQRAELRAARAAERDHKAAVKDVQRRFHEAQMEEARRLTDLAKEQIRSLENLLIQSLDRDSRVDPAVFRREPPAPPLPLSEPTLEDFLPPRPSFFTRLMPGSSARHAKEVADAHDKYVAAISEHHAKSTDQYSAWYAEADEVQQFNDSLDELKTGVERSLAPSIIEYFTIVIENFPLNENFSPKATVGYIGDSTAFGRRLFFARRQNRAGLFGVYIFENNGINPREAAARAQKIRPLFYGYSPNSTRCYVTHFPCGP